MIITEILTENTDLVRTYSDEGRFVVNQYGEAYSEAIDLKRFIDEKVIVYTEGEVIPPEERPIDEE